MSTIKNDQKEIIERKEELIKTLKAIIIDIENANDVFYDIRYKSNIKSDKSIRSRVIEIGMQIMSNE